MASLAVLVLGLAGCDNKDAPPSGDHKVYFFGYVYDGASGARLDKTILTGMSIRYRDKTLAVNIEDDGRFVTKDPLPTWQDYTVSIEATGYRSFFSQNRGIDVPASFVQNDMVATSGSTQTFQIDAYLFPSSLVAPKVTLTINLPPDPAATTQPLASGTIRLRPTTASTVESTPDPTRFRRWPNDNDLLTQTITQAFTAGQAVIDAGAMVYGVTYLVSVFDVTGYQPLVATAMPLVAGNFTSASYDLARETKDPLRVTSVDASNCTLPSPTTNAYGAQVSVTFSQPVAFSGTTYREDIDNSLVVSVVASSTSTYTCPLNTSVDTTVLERGTKVDVAGNVATFSWNPSMAWAPTYFGVTCGLPQSVTSVTYNIANAFPTVRVQPVGGSASDAVLLTSLLAARGVSVLACPAR